MVDFANMHRWRPTDDKGNYKCKNCPVKGRVPHPDVWPPMRTSAYIGPEYRQCDTARAAAARADLKRLGVEDEDLPVIITEAEE